MQEDTMRSASVRRAWLALALAALVPAAAGAQAAGAAGGSGSRTDAHLPSDLSLDIRPAYVFALPSVSATGASRADFGLAAGGTVAANYLFPGSPLFLTGGVDYVYAQAAQYSSVSAAEQPGASLSLAGARAGLGLFLPLSPAFSVYGFGAGGWYLGATNDFAAYGSNPYVTAGLGIRIALDPSFRISLGATYQNYLGTFSGIGAQLSLDLALGDKGGAVVLSPARLDRAFPVFYKFYDDHPVGTVAIRNNLKVPVSNLKAQVFVKDLMDSPKTVTVSGALTPGASKDIDLYALFNDKILGITEGTKVAMQIAVSFDIQGKTYTDTAVETLTMLGRNAMTWDDNRKAAAYVNAKDPGVVNFARTVTSYVRGRETRLLNDNLVNAMALHQALDLYGMDYAPNPITPYEAASQDTTVVDFLQFPRETLQYHAGDCSDLSILYASLFQALGVDTAFITVPGHIFVAIDTKLTPDQAVKELIPASLFIEHDGHAWVPIEITLRRQGFMAAWQLGATEWAQNAPSGKAGIWPVAQAWKVYEPVGLPGADPTVSVPQSDKVFVSYKAEMDHWVDTSTAPQVTKLQAQIASSGSVTAMNQLGILYAKYGDAAKALAQFQAAVARKPDYLAAILNIGNINYMGKTWDQALVWYKKAALIDATNSKTILALARVNLELKNVDAAAAQYGQLKVLDPKLAQQYAYLGDGGDTGGTRASDVDTQRRAVEWESDQ
jgi:hypothetical protein